jgi:hypothetical protein
MLYFWLLHCMDYALPYGDVCYSGQDTYWTLPALEPSFQILLCLQSGVLVDSLQCQSPA